MAKGQMVINYVPGEDCRVAVVFDGKLNELHGERMDNVSHVGNIYVGKVVNVEAAIQAAFVDFGLEHNGFLHVSDLHPQYFPDANEETTERVGKKTPRRDRPPIQECLRRGQEIAVQVLKEGVGTKGPTVTSYLSIPGRFLVMMPQMDRVGVSRKVEDEETRRKMREILDQLDLPEGFGFILRTAGMDRGKMELKRDLAYLSRLWKDMEKRWKSGNKPRLLYSESDLLVRALRDILSSDIDEVVVDNDAAMTRAGRFLKIVAPRSTTKLIHYTGQTPIFHAMGLEEQIQMIHAREVPLPSGGRLVIDETEALVAIDVNSGKSRDARDAETNAYRTNMEAAEEICRQLRLRDLGGVIINDLIDMRFAKHRREVETKFKDLLKKDRARWTTAPISEFGILEMTRQRMRGSHESQHFADCPTCRGRGLVQKPDSVAADGLRELAAILDHERVYRVEMVVSPRIAGEFLSAKRRALSRIERSSGKHVDVRVSEAIPVDRVTFYAYDDRGADIDVTKLGRRKLRENEMVEFELPKAALADDWADTSEVVEPEPADEPNNEPEMELHPIEIEGDDVEEPITPMRPNGRSRPGGGAPAGDGEGGERRGRRRRRRGRRGGPEGADAPGAPAVEPRGAEPVAEPRGPRGRGAAERAGAQAGNNGFAGAHGAGPAPVEGEEAGTGGRRRRRRRRRGRGGRGGEIAPAAGVGEGGEAGAGGPGGFEASGPDREAGESGEYESSDGGRLEVGAGGEGEAGEGFGADADGPSTLREGGEGGPGQPGQGPDGGEGGGGRRRRRRRRRRGGRGGEGGAAPVGGGPASGGEVSQPMDQGQYESDEPAGGPGGFAPTEDGGESSSELAADEQDGGERSGPDGGSGGGEGGPRKRRRRRRGRGGRGGAGPAGGPESAGAGGGGSAGPGGERVNQDRRDGPRGPGGPGGPRGQPPREPQVRGGGGPAPRPAQAPAPAASGAPKPRTLYSSRRRLGPGERRPPADE